MADDPKRVTIQHGDLPQRKEAPSAGDRVLIEAVSAHLERTFGRVLGVIHEERSRHIHVDLHIVPPSDARPVLIVATSGMAERPLRTASGQRTWTELVVVLPASWPTDKTLGRPECFWPLSLMRWLAHFPHQTGVGYQPLDDVGPIPQSGTPASPLVHAALLVEQPFLPPMTMVGREVTFLAMCPLHLDELEWVRRDGVRALLAAFDEAGHETGLIDPERPSLAPQRSG